MSYGLLSFLVGNAPTPISSANPLPITGGTGGGAITGPLGPSTSPTAAVAIADTGTPITGTTIPTGGVGITGWLSGIWQLIKNITGTAGTAATGVVSVQGIAGATNLPVSQATAASLNATVVGTGTFATQATAVDLGTQADAAASTDTGTFSLIALFKRLLQKFTTGIIVTNAGTFAVQAAQATAASLNATIVGTGTFATQSAVTQASPSVGAAAIAVGQITVANSATLIAAARTGASGTGRVDITITQTGTVAVYLGGSGVTSGTGDYLQPVPGSSITISTTAAIYGITASSTSVVTYMETF